MSSPIPVVFPFQFRSSTVRAVIFDDEHWFVAKDVCDILDIENSRDAVASLDADERITVAITDGNRGNPNHTVISESGLYALIFKSRKPEAKAFRKWVTGEVLPALRKTGRYASPSLPSSPPSLPGRPDQRPGPEWFTMKEIAAAWNMPRRNAALRVDKLVAQGRAVKHRTPGNPWRPWYYRFTDGAAPVPVPAPVPATAPVPEPGAASAPTEGPSAERVIRSARAWDALMERCREAGFGEFAAADPDVLVRHFIQAATEPMRELDWLKGAMAYLSSFGDDFEKRRAALAAFRAR